MVDERPFAVGAGLDVAAIPAEHDRGRATPVEDQDRLLAGRRVERGQGRGQRPRQQAALAGGQLLAEVDDFHGRCGADRPGRQDDAIELPRACPADALDRGCRGPEDDRGTGQSAQGDRRIARLEPRGPVALVRGVVLLVDDDQPDVREGCHDREPRPDNDIDVAGADPPPLVRPLALAEARVQESDARVEVGTQPVHQGKCEGDLGDEDQRRPAGLERGRDRLDVDGRLATARDAIEKERSRVAGDDGGSDACDGLGLGREQIAARRAPATTPGRTGRQRPAGTLADVGSREITADEAGHGSGPVMGGQAGGGELVVGRGGQFGEGV